MLLTIGYTGEDTQNIGFLFRKNPARPQVFELSHGRAFIFYPEVSHRKTTIALLLDIDPVDLARGRTGSAAGGLFDYVNDRPYVSSSFMSVAIARVFGSAMSGRSEEFQALANAALDLTATLAMLPCRSETAMLHRVFEPLGYEVSFETFESDEKFPEWRGSRYVNLSIRGKVRLADLLHHMYVLIPVFDRNKHYWIGREEVDKLLRHSEEWLKDHPEKNFIARRYLSKSRALANLALARLRAANDEPPEDEDSPQSESGEEERLGLATQRLGSVLAAVRSCGARAACSTSAAAKAAFLHCSSEKKACRKSPRWTSPFRSWNTRRRKSNTSKQARRKESASWFSRDRLLIATRASKALTRPVSWR
jgi:3' terminal RNA ribose 2'-O-methyltransferase Hen1